MLINVAEVSDFSAMFLLLYSLSFYSETSIFLLKKFDLYANIEQFKVKYGECYRHLKKKKLSRTFVMPFQFT